MSKILITGANGQLGTELRKLFDYNQIDYLATDMDNLDITSEVAVNKYFDEHKPTAVFHCAAFTAVDLAEDEKRELNWLVNVDGTVNIAKASEKYGAILYYISTDYVFDGDSLEEYQVDSITNPRNEYGKAKLAGEQAVQKYSTNHYIIRTSWVFGEYGHNFVFTMLKLAETHDKLTVVSDQIGRPTWTKTLANFLLHLYQKKSAFGIYHLSNDGTCSWYEFATEILKDKAIDIQPVTSEEYPQEAYRPRHSVMDLDKAKETGFYIPSWTEALATFLAINENEGEL